jgi:carbamoyl-phosphate synthase small subunit
MVGRLALEDGTIFTGRAFGATGKSVGEVVFNTSMTGYQEILTDPSYCGQIVTMTCPHIGNTGVNDDDLESGSVQVRGFVVREMSPVVSNYRSQTDLAKYLERAGVFGIEGIDTRALVRLLRTGGAMRGVLSSGQESDVDLVAMARSSPSMAGSDLVRLVTPKARYQWVDGFTNPLVTYLPVHAPVRSVVAIDYGMKRNILRCLTQIGCAVTVLPGNATVEQVLALDPDGVFLSNGPGDPAAVTYAIDTIKGLIGKKPIFGICLGHQLLALALGAKTFKLKFGHRGGNHPVRNMRTGKVEITSQNHGFAVDPATLPADVEPSHQNLNDGTLEGLRHKTLPVFSVQYHPEASAGPHDSSYLFLEFAKLLGIAS